MDRKGVVTAQGRTRRAPHPTRVLILGSVLAAAAVGTLGFHQATLPSAAARTVRASATERAWLAYRAGERGDVAPTVQAWLAYRAGERGDVAPTVQAWLDYRAGERGDTGTG